VSQVLVVEDDLVAALQYKVSLEARRHKVIITDNGEDCLEAYWDALDRLRAAGLGAQWHPYDTVIIDYKIPKIDGAEVAQEILVSNPRQRILFATAYMSELMGHFSKIARLGRYVEILQKPFDKDVLTDIVEDKALHEELRAHGVDVDALLMAGATHDQLMRIAELNRSNKGNSGG
jgi:CheY-like chemotaxis protein